MKKKFDTIIMVTAALVIGALTAVFSQIRPLLHMSAKASYNETEAVKTVLMTGAGKCSIIMNDEDSETTGRYINKLSVAIYPKEKKALKLIITVYTDNNGRAEIFTITDTNPVYVKNEIIKIDRENVVSVDIESPDRRVFSLSGIKVLNGFVFNYSVFIYASLSALALLFCIWLSIRRKDIDKASGLRRVFLVASLCFGTCLCICLPANKVGYDEETHLQAVMQTASFPSNELHISNGLMNQLCVTEYNNPEAQPGSIEEIREFESALSMDADYKDGERNPDFHVMANRVPAYISMAVAAKIGKGLSLPWPAVLRMIRFANLLVYIILMWATLRILPFGHTLMTVIGLLPQNLFMASTVSYDPFVTGCLMLGMAFLLRILYAEDGNRKLIRDTSLMLVFMFLGCLPKAVYAPLMLIALAVPFRKFADRQQRYLYMCAVISVFVFTLLLFVIPTIVAPADTGDVRGASDVSEMSQMGFIFSNPLKFAWILLRQMIRWIPQCLIGPDCTIFMGHLVTGTYGFTGFWFIIFLIIILASSMDTDSICISQKERLWNIFMCFGTGVLIWSAMYISFTSPGAEEIDGVQGRYFIPVLFPLYLSLFGGAAGIADIKKPEGKTAKLVSAGRIWYYLLMTVLIGIITVTLWKTVIFPYCL